MVRHTGLVLRGDVRVVGTDRTAAFVAFSLASGDGVRLVERGAVVYVDAADSTVRGVEHEWHDRVEHLPPGAWLPVADGWLDQVRVAGPGGSVSWVRVAPAPAWLGEGTAVWHATGGPLSRFDDLPAEVRALVEAQRPEFAFAPVLDLAATIAAVPRRLTRGGTRRRR